MNINERYFLIIDLVRDTNVETILYKNMVKSKKIWLTKNMMLFNG